MTDAPVPGATSPDNTTANAQFSRPGAMDLSGLTQAAGAEPATGGGPDAPAAAGSSWVIQVTEASFDQTMQLSLRHPVVLELWSPRAQGAEQLSADLVQLTNAAAGQWLLARVNVDTDPRIAQALQVQAVPTVVAVIGGQLAPLFQGTQPREQIKAALDQVVQVSAASGIVGRAEPVAGGPTGEQEPVADPRFAKADEALERGDLAAALAEYDALLAQTPRDAQVQAGRAQVALMMRAQGEATDGDDPVGAELAAADQLLVQGDLDGAFERLLTVVRENDGDERERARVRLLELFAVVGNSDPAVLRARRALSTALF
ncbi:tetratricopeptide repeat protein [Aestuariimicrobium ganziense]|uniref:tetratricopeptide repeat protein n=1 Tax=Aestuariimicrobium ganziense TaxID=2773677 RepID=UPI0019431348|nr:tetratricopeptide repeat protein [Aestuariimicrobium ganziense]